jgi:hypothetical protein
VFVTPELGGRYAKIMLSFSLVVVMVKTQN